MSIARVRGPEFNLTANAAFRQPAAPAPAADKPALDKPGLDKPGLDKRSPARRDAAGDPASEAANPQSGIGRAMNLMFVAPMALQVGQQGADLVTSGGSVASSAELSVTQSI